MTEKPLDTIKAVYRRRALPWPQPRVWALRLLEEAAELALAAGVSPADIYLAVDATMANEHKKTIVDGKAREFDEERIAPLHELTGEVADCILLLDALTDAAGIPDEGIAVAARMKVDRLTEADLADRLIVKDDGRLYRRKEE